MLKQIVTIAIIAILVLCVTLTMTDITIKMTRYAIDSNQYGKRFSTITVRDEQATLENSRNANERIDKYRDILHATKRYATWPNLTNFDDTWQREAIGETRLPRKSVWYVKREHTEPTDDGNKRDGNENAQQSKMKRVLIFVHGGATFAGSPHKYNNMHWLKTIGWLGAMEHRYTDIVSIDYRLRPEFTIDDSIRDCLESIRVVLETGNVEILHLLGFSAGGMLCLQTTAILEKAGEYYDDYYHDDDEHMNKYARGTITTKIFNVNVATDATIRKLCDTRKSDGLWRQVTRKQLYLIAPLCRLDRLFINRRYDVSHIIQTFSETFFDNDSYVYDPMFNMNVHDLRLREFDLITIVDVCRNSLSNHVINLYEYLRAKRNDDEMNKIRVDVWDERDLQANRELLRQIRMYDLRSGKETNRFVQTELNKLERKKSPNENQTAIDSFLVYHFFMYIVPCDASWKTLRRILVD